MIPWSKQNVDNLALAGDSYKLTHYNQYHPDTEGVYSYFESRPGAKYDETVFFGLQYVMQKYLVGQAVTPRDVEEAMSLAGKHFSNARFNLEGWNHIAYECGGLLPIRIRAVPEGTPVPVGNVLMTVENTDPRAYWLTNALESLLVHVWYPSTVATLSRETLKMIGRHLDETGCTRDGLPFMLHDFGYRGASSHESAAIGGAAHLVNSRGTDTLPGMIVAQRYYAADPADTAFSVPATEHSVMTASGMDGEMAIVDRLLNETPEGILSVVADSYDVYRFVTEVGTTFKQRVLDRDGVLVVRPDSVTDLHPTPASLMVELSERLWKSFGGEINGSYRTLDSHVRLLWGDGIDPDGIDAILTACAKAGFAAENYVFGMGGGLLQKVNRDTQRFAFKCSAQRRRGAWFNVQKNPLDKSKVSKAGRLSLVRQGDGFATTPEVANGDLLETVFENGKIVKDYTFAEVRERAAL